MSKLSFLWWKFWWWRRAKRILKTESTEQIIGRLKRAGLYIEGRQQRMLMDNEQAREWLIRDPEIDELGVIKNGD